jgi:hypothetical protein
MGLPLRMMRENAHHRTELSALRPLMNSTTHHLPGAAFEVSAPTEEGAD